ncbi:hypothetical protein [Candidatus Scalindua japonica]|uniref:hypothetical protein n=1 Tax=Candidatus Scalindua japonica TaxID=1284222 RepID=UPI0013A54D6B|nr:hypothetical protein [Candidatus Scalindua japonica]
MISNSSELEGLERKKYLSRLCTNGRYPDSTRIATGWPVKPDFLSVCRKATEAKPMA